MTRFPPALLLVVALLALGLVYLWHAPALILLLPALVCLAWAGTRRAPAAVMVVASILVTLFVIEAGLALLRPEGGSRLTEEHGDQLLAGQPAIDVGYLPAPGRYAAQLTTRGGEPIFDAVYTVGEDGLRVTPDQRDNGPDRVNFFGCSFTFGLGLADDETITYYLERELEQEVKNFSFMGWGPHQALVLLESERDMRASANVLLTAPWHAPRATCSPRWSGGTPRFRLTEDGALVRDGLCPDPQANPLLITLRRLRLVVLVERVQRVLTGERRVARQLDLYYALIDRIAALSEARGQPFIIAYIGADALGGVPLDNARIKQRLAASGATVVDVSLAASEAELAPDYYLHDFDRHPSAQANAERARLLAPVLAPILKE